MRDRLNILYGYLAGPGLSKNLEAPFNAAPLFLASPSFNPTVRWVVGPSGEIVRFGLATYLNLLIEKWDDMGQSSESSAGRLTTHVLDTATGSPAAGIQVDLFRFDGEEAILISTATTNADGRCDAPFLSGESMVVGAYQLVFRAGDYFRAQGLSLSEPLFLDIVPLRFGISEPAKHYHVPLLISPFGYSTYRGS